MLAENGRERFAAINEAERAQTVRLDIARFVRRDASAVINSNLTANQLAVEMFDKLGSVNAMEQMVARILQILRG